MDLKQLQYFKHVAELGSFSKAAAFLSVAQPALSRQIRKLETDLNVRLLYRNGRGVTATEAGHLLLDRANALLEQFDRVEHEMRALDGVVGGSVTLGVPPTVSQVLIRPLINHFRKLYPQVSLEVVEGFSGHVHEWLADGRLDVALLYNAPRTRHLSAERLLIEELFLICPPEPGGTGIGEIALDGLSEVPLILPSRPHGLRLLVDEVAGKHGLALRVDFEINALSAIKDLVEDGAGATILPYAAVYREATQGRMTAKRIAGGPFTRTLVLATSTQRPLSLAARAVVERIKVEVKELHAAGNWHGATL
ncbi:MAG: LysR substrate-binding domain-containing protein, partial [Alphaproteobacteria bacterium]|nr:LysR substrate-binding domain-containing protein [Alphaproteobacteria bacterium]